MKRYTAIKKLIELLKDSDILIFSGNELCKEAYEYDRPNNFYIQTPVVAASFGLGIAMCNPKRVFVFMGEGELLRDMGIITQLGSSRCDNMFLVLLDNGCYQSAGQHPNIFENILSLQGVVYNSGSQVSNFSKHFKLSKIKMLRQYFDRLAGPKVIFVEVDKGFKKDLPDVKLDLIEHRDRLTEMVRNTELESALFKPQPLGGQTIRSINIDELEDSGGIDQWLSKT